MKLNDRLMSKSYSDFAHGERVRSNDVVSGSPEETIPAGFDPIAEENARRANSLFL